MFLIGFPLVCFHIHLFHLLQFSLFAWTHVALLCVVTQSYLIIQNMFEGLIWFIMPIMMVIINDIMAYMFGFAMGRTPLIQVRIKNNSPRENLSNLFCSVESKEDLGGFHWRRVGHCCHEHRALLFHVSGKTISEIKPDSIHSVPL